MSPSKSRGSPLRMKRMKRRHTCITRSIIATHTRVPCCEYVARRGKKPGAGAMTPSSAEFHVDPDVHQNTAGFSRGTRGRPLRFA